MLETFVRQIDVSSFSIRSSGPVILTMRGIQVESCVWGLYKGVGVAYVNRVRKSRLIEKGYLD